MADEETARPLPGGVPFTNDEVAKASHVNLDMQELGSDLAREKAARAAVAKADFSNGPAFRAKFKHILTELLKLDPPPTVHEWQHWIGRFCSRETLEICYMTFSMSDFLRQAGLANPASLLAEAQLLHYEAQRYPQRRKVREAIERLGRLGQEVSTSFKSSFIDAAITGKVDDVARRHLLLLLPLHGG